MSSSCGAKPTTSMMPLPLGFRFQPTDYELFIYLQRKILHLILPSNFIKEVELYKYHPTELIDQSRVNDDEKYYFFTSTERKHTNGGRLNRSAKNGFWKGTTGPTYIKNNRNSVVGEKRQLVFYDGKPPYGKKTKWIMHEYKLNRCQSSEDGRNANKDPMKLDECICSIYENLSASEKRERKRMRNVHSKELVAISENSNMYKEGECITDEYPQQKRRRMGDVALEEAILSAQAIAPLAYANSSDGIIYFNQSVGSFSNEFVGGNNSICLNNNFLHKELQATTQHELDYPSCFNEAEQINSTLNCDFVLKNDVDYFNFYNDASPNHLTERSNSEMQSDNQNHKENANKDVNAQEDQD